jgi:hypothetical protein
MPFRNGGQHAVAIRPLLAEASHRRFLQSGQRGESLAISAGGKNRPAAITAIWGRFSVGKSAVGGAISIRSKFVDSFANRCHETI